MKKGKKPLTLCGDGLYLFQSVVTRGMSVATAPSSRLVCDGTDCDPAAERSGGVNAVEPDVG